MILEKFKDTVRKYDLFTEGDTILIAFSGGVDSTALLNLLLDLQREWPIELFLGHFNHKIRSSADRDETFVRKIAEEKSVQLYVGFEDVPAYAEENKLNIEEAGRILRYRFLKKTAEQLGDALVATGHTMTDQAETFLMRLFRGSGMRGLSGIHPYRDDKIIRPLLLIEREEIESYLKERGETFSLDESNRDPAFLRNRVRNELLPYLRENFEPKIVQRISQMTSLLRDEDALLDELTEDVSKGIYTHRKGHIALDVMALLRLPRAFQRRLVRNFLCKIKKDLRNISYDNVETILGLAEGKELHLTTDLILKRERGLIVRQDGDPIKPVYELYWDGQANITIPELQMTFKGERRRRSSEFPLCFDDRVSVCLDWYRVQFPLKIRNRIEGDRYHPLGAPGRKKLKEIMRSKGIPPAERNDHPVFISGDEIVWIWGLPVSEIYKVTENSREIFVISLNT
ncbi:tRNA lysidine(34) synthetase TilS [Acidobacteriota bacterium]